MKRLRVAAVGLGWVTVNRHLPWLRRCPDVELAGVIDPRPERASAIAAQLKIRPGIGSQAQDVAWLDEVDAVTIGTPPRTHFALVQSFLEAGKHVLVEKPMAMTPTEAAHLVQAAESNALTLAVVHNFQFARATRRLAQMRRDGELGELLGIAAVQLSNPKRRLPSWYQDLPLGLFYDESPHLLYLVRSLMAEEPRIVRADVVSSRSGQSTPALVDLRLDGSVPVTITMRFEAPVSEWHLAVFGSKRLAVVDIFRDVLVVTPNDGRHGAGDIMRTSAATIISHLWGVARAGGLLVAGRLAYGNDEVIRRFVRACQTGQPPAGISAVDGLRVVELQHQVLRTQARAAA